MNKEVLQIVAHKKDVISTEQLQNDNKKLLEIRQKFEDGME